MFTNLDVNGFCFDVQIVKMALRMGYKVVEVPIRWEERRGSSMRLIRDGMRMLIDLIRIKLNRSDYRGDPPKGFSANPTPHSGLYAISQPIFPSSQGRLQPMIKVLRRYRMTSEIQLML